MNTWLWPDKRIGKRESRKLREEHNAAVNLNAELVEALEELQKGIYDFTELPIYAKNFVYRITTEALAKARGES